MDYVVVAHSPYTHAQSIRLVRIPPEVGGHTSGHEGPDRVLMDPLLSMGKRVIVIAKVLARPTEDLVSTKKKSLKLMGAREAQPMQAVFCSILGSAVNNQPIGIRILGDCEKSWQEKSARGGTW